MNKVSKIVSLLLIVFLFSGCISYDDPIRKVFCNATGSNKEYCEIGKEVSIGDEHFYIISSNDETVTLLAKYNLLVGNEYNSSWELINTYSDYGMQSENAKGFVVNDSRYVGTVVFDSEYETNSHGYWTTSTSPYSILPTYGTSYPLWAYDDNATIKKYVDNYKNTLEETYGKSIDEARLIKYEELEKLGCDSDENTCTTASSWIYNTSYWTGSIYNDDHVWYVGANGYFGNAWFVDGGSLGVRPVITISRDQLQL